MSESNEVEVAKYEITGLVDKFDEQMVITGQLPVGSIQELPVEYGDKCVEAGTAKRVVEASSDEEEEAEDEDEVTTGEDDATGGTGATGEEEVE